MKVNVEVEINNSPRMPINPFYTEHEFIFDDDENVFGRVLEVRKYFKTKYGENIDLTILNCVQIAE